MPQLHLCIYMIWLPKNLQGSLRLKTEDLEKNEWKSLNSSGHLSDCHLFCIMLRWKHVFGGNYLTIS